jgi:hypothetical protein
VRENTDMKTNIQQWNCVKSGTSASMCVYICLDLSACTHVCIYVRNDKNSRNEISLSKIKSVYNKITSKTDEWILFNFSHIYVSPILTFTYTTK